MPPRHFKAFFLMFPTWHSAFNDPINDQSAAPLTLSFWSLGSRNLWAPTTSFFPRVMGPLYMVTGVNKNPTYRFFFKTPIPGDGAHLVRQCGKTSISEFLAYVAKSNALEIN